MQLKMQELELKKQKQTMDAAAKADQLKIEEARIAMQKEIAAMQVGATTAAARDKLNKQMELEGTRLGIDVAKSKAQMGNDMHKHKSQLAHQNRQSAMQAVQQARQPKSEKKGD